MVSIVGGASPLFRLLGPKVEICHDDVTLLGWEVGGGGGSDGLGFWYYSGLTYYFIISVVICVQGTRDEGQRQTVGTIILIVWDTISIIVGCSKAAAPLVPFRSVAAVIQRRWLPEVAACRRVLLMGCF